VPEGEFELREIEWTPAKAALVSLMLGVATVHLAVATTMQYIRFAVLGLGLLVCFVVFFTDVWRPRHNAVGAGYIVLMGAVWLYTFRPLSTVGYVDTAMKVALFVLFGYLLLAERRDIDPEEAGS